MNEEGSSGDDDEEDEEEDEETFKGLKGLPKGQGTISSFIIRLLLEQLVLEHSSSKSYHLFKRKWQGLMIL